MKLFFTLIVIITTILFLPSFITAICCPDGCYLDKNVCCGGIGYVGCQDGNGQYYCDGTYVFPVGKAALPDACLTCKCPSQDNCYWEINTFCQNFYGSNYKCIVDNPTVPTATECVLPPLCPEGTTLCADGYCRKICNPFHFCGDGTCDADESCSSCPSDCGTCPPDTCPNGNCGATESCSSCPSDCGTCPPDTCPNGKCGATESCSSCPSDCGTCPPDTCPNGKCGATEDCFSCPSDCGTCPPDTCPNGKCGATESCSSCPSDCGTCPSHFCGDDTCNEDEDCSTCQTDCGACGSCTGTCGDNCCDTNEDCSSCPSDCGACPPDTCPNGNCGPTESCSSCPSDCGTCPPDTCPNGKCGATESCSSCPSDCGTCPPDTCPNGKCGATESCSSCPSDCGTCPPDTCPNGKCGPTEDCTLCPSDCGTCPPDTCPNGKCGPTEDCTSCEADCGICGCSNQEDSCCNAENDGICDADCVEKVDPNCPITCTTNEGDCCHPYEDGVCDPDCISGVDPDCSPICQNIADSCCNAENDGTCDPDCVTAVDPDCPTPCDNTQNNCCNPLADGVCDPDCIVGVDPDCSIPECDNDGNCEAGEGCLCIDCNLVQDACEASLVCINSICQTPTTSCKSCEDCDGIIGGCSYNECMLCGANCYYAGYSLLANDCKTCSPSTTCEDYEQTETICNKDDCNLGACVWDGANCITVDYITVKPNSAEIKVGNIVFFTTLHHLSDAITDVTALTQFTSNKVAIATTKDNIATALAPGMADITANYNNRIGTSKLTVTAPDAKTSLSHIMIGPSTAIIKTGLQQAYTVTAYYSDGTNEDVTHSTWYETSDLTVASISGNIATANASGRTTITATYNEGVTKTDTAILTVTDSAQKILSYVTINPSHSSIKIGAKRNYTVTAHYSDASTTDVTSLASISSSDSSIVSITGNSAEAKALGVAVLTTTYTENAVTKTVRAILSVVNANFLSDIAIDPSDPKLIIGSKMNFIVDAYYTDGTTKDVTSDATYSLDDSVASLSCVGGTCEITGLKIGTTTLTATYIEDGLTKTTTTTLTIDNPDSSPDFCELKEPTKEQDGCDNLETGCWSLTVNEDAEITDQTRCCGNNADEIWKYFTATTLENLFSNDDTCYKEYFYDASLSPITYYSLYTTK